MNTSLLQIREGTGGETLAVPSFDAVAAHRVSAFSTAGVVPPKSTEWTAAECPVAPPPPDRPVSSITLAMPPSLPEPTSQTLASHCIVAAEMKRESGDAAILYVSRAPGLMPPSSSPLGLNTRMLSLAPSQHTARKRPPAAHSSPMISPLCPDANDTRAPSFAALRSYTYATRRALSPARRPGPAHAAGPRAP
jgi:hypothetical protein